MVWDMTLLYDMAIFALMVIDPSTMNYQLFPPKLR